MANPILSKSAGALNFTVCWRALRPYAAAAGAVGLAAVLRWELQGLFGDGVKFITFYPAVALVGMVAGGRAGMLATVLSAVAADWLFLEPKYHLAMHSLPDLVALGFFVAAGVLMSLTAEMLGQARKREWQALERKKAAEEVQRSEWLLKQSQAMAHLGSWELDLLTNRLYWSDEVYRIFGLGVQEFGATYEAFLAAVHPEDRAAVDAAYSGSLREGKDSYEIEHRVIRKVDGAIRIVHEKCEHHRNQSGRIIRSVGMVHDITEGKQAEKTLRDSEQRLRTLFDATFSGIAITEQGRFVEVNDELARMLGYQSQELIGVEFATLMPFEDAQRVLQNVESGREVFIEHTYLRKDGSPIQVEAHGKTIQLYGRTVRFTALRDITEQKRAREALRESEARLRQAVDTAELGLYERDVLTNRLSVNENLRRIAGLPSGELAADFAVKVLHPEDRGRVLALVARAFDPQLRELFAVQFRILWPDGQVRWVSGRGRVVFDDTALPPRPVKFVGVLRDISQSKRAEEALRQSEARLAQAIRVAGLGTFEHDHALDYIEHSPQMRKLMNFGADEKVTVETLVQRVAPEDRAALAAAIRRAHDPAGDGLFETEFRVSGPDGRLRWICAWSQTFFEGQGSERRPVRTIGAGLDVTERKEFQARLERLVVQRTAKLQEMVGELEHFSYTITHDMRAPLRAMKGFGELVNDLCADCPRQEQKQFLRRIMTSADRMDALIRDALNYSRSIRQELPLEPVDSAALLRGMLDSYPEFQPSKARIRIDGELPVVLGNEAGLTQCFSNLLGNAVKFVKPGQTPEIRVWAEPREGSVRLWVEDHGIGIPEQMLPRVFDMFSRGHNTYEGTGIGLALVRKVMDRMGGKLGVESQEGKGSRFWLELRVAGAQSLTPLTEFATKTHREH